VSTARMWLQDFQKLFSAENFLTCKLYYFTFSENDNSVDYMQHTCFALTLEYLVHTVIWNESSYAKVLSMIKLDLDL